jgi:hypothetical protein
MAISFYDVSVGSYLQTLGAAQGFLQKSLDWGSANGVDADQLVEARLCDDMHPLRFQIQQIVFHSAGSLDAIRNGVLAFAHDRPKHSYAELQALVAKTVDDLRALSREDVDALEANEVAFRVPGKADRLFTAEGFLLSFSLPNFHFHATTAYAILRNKGAPVGKTDFMGALKLKG